MVYSVTTIHLTWAEALQRDMLSKDRELIIEGEFDSEVIIKEMIAREYAIEVTFAAGAILRVGHHKGTWYCVKKTEKTCDYLEYYDSGDIECDNQLLLGLAKEIDRTTPRKAIYPEVANRDDCAEVLCRIIPIWVNPFAHVLMIKVIQPGRNAYLEKNGDWSLHYEKR